MHQPDHPAGIVGELLLHRDSTAGIFAFAGGWAASSADFGPAIGGCGFDAGRENIEAATRIAAAPEEAAANAKALIQQLRCLQRAISPRCCAEHNGNQRTTIALCRRDKIKPGCANKAGFHAHGARISPDQPVCVVIDPVPQLDGSNGEQAGIIRKFREQGTRQNGHIARRCHLRRIMKPVRVEKMALAHPKARGFAVHHAGKSRDCAAHTFCDDDSNIIRAFDHQDFQRVFERDFLPRLEANLAWRLL